MFEDFNGTSRRKISVKNDDDINAIIIDLFLRSNVMITNNLFFVKRKKKSLTNRFIKKKHFLFAQNIYRWSQHWISIRDYEKLYVFLLYSYLFVINSVTSDLKMQKHAITYYICILVLFMKKSIIIISPTNKVCISCQ